MHVRPEQKCRDASAYRADIDGLRAVAVLSVIAFHMYRPFLPGGYLGVDIFFVISGFLITKIIWQELQGGHFSIASFYVRRIRRIAPALLGVLIVSSLASYAILLPIDLLGFARSLLASLAFVANVYFWRDTNYFSRVAEEKPLLHLWSLGIEEQFYIFFPILLILLRRYGNSVALLWTATLVVLSFVMNCFLLHIGGAAPAFYLLPTRAWELGVGALCAIAPTGNAGNRRLMVLLSIAGAAFVALAVLNADLLQVPEVPIATPVVLGTAALIWSGRDVTTPTGRLLSTPALVTIGLASYSLYLWHWPILVLSKYYLVRDLRAPEILVAAIVTLAVAMVSWRYVERPFRSSRLPTSNVLVFSAVTSIVVCGLGAAMIFENGFPSRLNASAALINAAVGTNYRCAVGDYLYLAQSRACVLELPSRDPSDADVVLIGNSHAQMYAPAVSKLLRRQMLHGLLVPANSCLPTWGVNISSDCAELAMRNIEAVAALKRARVVVIGTTWTEPLAGGNEVESRAIGDRFLIGVDATIAHLRAAGKKVVLIGPLAVPGWDVASITSRSLAFGRPVENDNFFPEDAFLKQYSGALSHFERRGDVEFVRPDRIQCRLGRCEYFLSGESLFADDNHLAASALHWFEPILDEAIQRALEDDPVR